MNDLASVQDAAAAQILADPVLAAFGTPRVFDIADDDDAVKDDIATRLREKGVCIEVGDYEADEAETDGTGVSRLRVEYPVYVAEVSKVAHQPAGKALVKRVIAAVTKKTAPLHKPPRLIGRALSGRSEGGYILHELWFADFITVR